MDVKDLELAGEWKIIIRKASRKYWLSLSLFASVFFVAPLILLFVNKFVNLQFSLGLITALLIVSIFGLITTAAFATAGPFIFRSERLEALKIVYPSQFLAYEKLMKSVYVKKAEQLMLKKSSRIEKAIADISNKDYGGIS